MAEKMKRILLFDIDGTLIKPSKVGHISFRRALEDVYGVVGPLDDYNMAGKTDWQIVTDLMRLAGLDTEAIEARRMDAFAAYARHFSIIPITATIPLLPGVTELMARLATEEDFILGLVTGNVREVVPHKLRAGGLDPGMFEFGAFGSEHIDRNTLPALALYRLSQMRGGPVSPESALVIGDTPLDIACARHAGVKVLCVATGRYSQAQLWEYNPDYVLEDLSDTDRVLEIFNQF